MLGDHTRAATATVRAAAAARARGSPSSSPRPWSSAPTPTSGPAAPHAAEAAALDALRQAYATGQDNGACHLQAALAMFAALTGDDGLCRERAAAARSYALAHGLGLPAALAQWALAFLDLGNGRYAAAAARLRALAASGPGHGHRAVRHLATPHYVEAAVRTGDTRVARAAHADYDRWARAVGSPDDLALSARCRALLTPGADALPHYAEPSTCTRAATAPSNAPARNCCSAVRCADCAAARRHATGCTAPFRRSSPSTPRTARRAPAPNSARWAPRPPRPARAPDSRRT